MKKLLDRIWARILFFCLLIVFSVLSVAGYLWIYALLENNVYLDGGESYYDGLYGGFCYEDIYRAYSYITSGSEGVRLPPDDETAADFASAFMNSRCAIRVSSGMEVWFENYSPTESCTYSFKRVYTHAGKAFTIAAFLDPDDAVKTYRQAGMDILIRWRYLLIALEIICIAGWIFCLAFTIASAGHLQGHEGIYLTWYGKLPVEVWLIGALAVYVWLRQEWSFFLHNGIAPWIPIAPALLVLLALPSISASCKAGRVWKGSITAWLLRVLRRFIKALGYVLMSISLVKRTTACVFALLLLNILCIVYRREHEFLFVMLFINIFIGAFIIFLSVGLRKLQMGGKALAAGDHEKQIDTKYLVGDLRGHAEDLNAVRQGIQKAVEQQMRAERMKTELITNVSHDIKTPLTSIISYVELLKKADIKDPDVADYIEVLDRQSARLKKMTEDVVMASGAATGNISAELVDTDVNVFLSQVLGEYRQKLEENGIEPVLAADASAPHILADGRLLWRVMDNLLSNVCKYSLTGTRVYLSSEAENGRVTITVKNISSYPLNISPDELMERFVRGDESRTTEGSGLGLSIAGDLVRIQNGEFKILLDGDLFKVLIGFEQVAEGAPNRDESAEHT